MHHQILVAEDDFAVANLIGMTLQMGKYKVIYASDGAEALSVIRNCPPDLALLDIMLPQYDGYLLLGELKAIGVPVIFVSAKTMPSDVAYGLRLGAEDYIKKPFDPMELLARVEAALRRAKPMNAVMRVGGVELNEAEHTVTVHGKAVSLAPMEYSLLALFMRNPNHVLSRDHLLHAVWGYDYAGGTRTVDMHVQRLRAKLGLAEMIQTVHRIGYKMETRE